MALVALLAAVAVLLAQPAHAAATECAAPATAQEARFASAPSGWLGGDGIFSVPLTSGREIWLFGDTFVGQDFAANSALLDDATGGLGLVSAPFLELPRGRRGWLWPGAGWVQGRDLWTIWTQMERTDAGAFGFRFVRNWIARTDVATLRLRSLTPVPDHSRIVWGASVLRSGSRMYIYGVEHHRLTKHAHLAVAGAADPRRAWRFYNRASWGATPTHAAHVAQAVASVFSVVRVGNGLAMVSQQPFSGHELRIATARSPAGPWGRWRVIYRPEVPATWSLYNAVAHPEVRGPGLLVSYSVSPDWGGPPTKEEARPRFVWVRRSCLIQGSIP